MYFNVIKKNRKIMLGLKMLGFLPIIPKSLPERWGPVHTWSQVTWGQYVQSQALRGWKLGLTTSHAGVPSLKSQSITSMPTWQHYLQVRLGTCVENWVELQPRRNFQHKSREYWCTKQWRSDFNECKPHFQWFLEAQKLGNFASMGRLGTWGVPCDTV
jgi:hypothetical protein